MRQLCNVAYVSLAEGLDADGVRELDVKLETPPGEKPVPQTYVDPGLLDMFGPG